MTVEFQNASLHNVAEFRPDGDGWLMQRVPETVRRHLNPTAQRRMLESVGVEVSFVADGPVEVVLSCESEGNDDPCLATVFHGRHQSWHGRSQPGWAA